MPSFHWWRTVFWLIPAISVYTIVLGALSLASMLVDRRGHVAHGCARAWSRLILVTTGVRVHSSGGDLVPAGGSYVFVSNHQSIYDFPVLITSIPFQLRILAKASLGAFPCSVGICATPGICWSIGRGQGGPRSIRSPR